MFLLQYPLSDTLQTSSQRPFICKASQPGSKESIPAENSVITYSGIELQAEKRALEKRKNELEAELQTEQERSEELEDRRAYMQTVRYIEEIARKVLGLVYPDETILRPEEEE